MTLRFENENLKEAISTSSGISIITLGDNKHLK